VRQFVHFLFLFIALTSFGFAYHITTDRSDNCDNISLSDIQSEDCRENKERNSDCKCHIVEVQLALNEPIFFERILYSRDLAVNFPKFNIKNVKTFYSLAIKPPIL
jgi:hypothetical protein